MAERVIDFDGRRISVPADATDDEVAGILGALPAGAPGAPPPQPSATVAASPAQPQPRSLVDAIMGAGVQGAAGLRKGLASVLGLPVDAVNSSPMLLNAIPGVDGVRPFSEKPFLGSESISDLLGGFGAVPEPPTPQGAPERLAARIGKEVGAAAVPVAGGLAAAARMGPQAARELGVLGRMFVEPAAVAPGNFAAKEATMALAAGTGAGLANEAVDPNTARGQLADAGGAVAGATLTGLGATLSKSAMNVIDALRQNPRYADQVVKDAVAERLLSAADIHGTPDAPANAEILASRIESGGREPVSSLVPGYRESVGDRTGDPGILALEYSRQSGPNNGRFFGQRSANAEAVGSALQAIAPTEQPGVFRNALQSERARRLKDTIANTQGVEAEAGDALRAIAPSMPDATARGASARAALQDAANTARDRVDEAYRPVNESTAQVDIKPLSDLFSATVAQLPVNDRLRFLPAEAQVPARLVPEGADIAPAPLREITSLRSGLAQDVGNARANNEPQRGRVAGMFKTQVEQFLDDSIPAELRAQYDAANAARRDFGSRFETQGSLLADALQRDSRGAYTADSSAIAPRLAPTDQGNVTDFRAAIREAGTDPRMRSAVADEIVSQAERAGVTQRPEALRQFLKDRSIVLSEFPELRQKLDSVANTTERAAAAREFQRGVERDLGTDTTPGTGPVGKYLKWGDAQSARAVKEVLSAADPEKAADDLVRFVGDNPRALEGAKSALWQHMREQATSAERTTSGAPMWRGDWLKQTLDNPQFAAVAEKFYADRPEHLAALRALGDVLDNTDLRLRARAPATSGTAQGLSNVLTPETLQSRAYAYMRGQISGTYLATSIAAVAARRAVRAARTDAVERMLDEVLLDPGKAILLLRENNPANRAALARGATGWKASTLSTLVNLAGDEDETRAAIMRRDNPEPKRGQ